MCVFSFPPAHVTRLTGHFQTIHIWGNQSSYFAAHRRRVKRIERGHPRKHPPRDSCFVTSLLCSSPVPLLTRGRCTFLHGAISIPPSCQWVSVERGAQPETETCRVTLTEPWSLRLGPGLPLRALPAAAWQSSLGGSLLAPRGNLTLDSALCTSRSVLLDRRPANSDGVLFLQTNEQQLNTFNLQRVAMCKCEKQLALECERLEPGYRQRECGKWQISSVEKLKPDKLV